MIDATGTRRRIQAMQRMGHSQVTIAARLGVTNTAVGQLLRRERVYPRTARAVAAVCAELGMTPGTSTAATTLARQKGWVSLLAWDNIDDPTERPHLGDVTEEDDGEVDHAAVAAATQGVLPASRMRIADRRAAMSQLGGTGRSVTQIADLLRTTTQMVTRDLRALRAERGAVA